MKVKSSNENDNYGKSSSNEGGLDKPAILKTDVAPSPIKNMRGSLHETNNLKVFNESSQSPFKDISVINESREGPIKVFQSKRDSSGKARVESSKSRKRSSSSQACLIRLQPTHVVSNKRSSEKSKPSNQLRIYQVDKNSSPHNVLGFHQQDKSL